MATDNYRWALSEDSTAFGTAGKHAIRDMWNPRCVNDPGRVTDAEYSCAITDSGGVHTNSGVPNHGFALLVDGGTYNEHTIAPIGLVKAAHLYFQAQLLQTPTTDFDGHADALEAACTALIGQPLAGLSVTATPAPPSGESISADDCLQVTEMIAAVELRIDPRAIDPDDPEMLGDMVLAAANEALRAAAQAVEAKLRSQLPDLGALGLGG